MQLTHYTDYSLRVLIFLALQGDRRLVTVSEIATHFQIARNHLVKVVNRLAQLGYVETVRGKGGGMRLGMAPDTIGIGQVVRAMESNMDIIDCSKPPCPLVSNCALKGILNQAMTAFMQALDQHTLAELTLKPQQIKTLLDWDIDAAH